MLLASMSAMGYFMANPGYIVACLNTTAVLFSVMGVALTAAIGGAKMLAGSDHCA